MTTDVPDLIAGLTFLALGLLSARRSGRYSLVALAAGLGWFAGNLSPLLVFVHRPLMLHAALSYSSGRLRGRSARVVLGLAWLGALVPPGRQPAWMMALAALIWVTAVRVRGRAELGDRGAGAASALATGALALALVWPAAARLWWPQLLPPGDLVAGYSGLIMLAGAILLGDLVLRSPAQETDAVIELSDLDPGDLPVELRREASSRSGSLAGRSLLAAAQLLELNAELQSQLAEKVEEVRASRRRLVEAAVGERYRLEQLLANGALRHLAELHEALAALGRDSDGEGEAGVRELVAACLLEVERTREDLEQFARGLHPRVLQEHGLRTALNDLAVRCPIPIAVEVLERRFAPAVETAVWYACAEAMANLVKHARARTASVEVWVEADQVLACVRDQGMGGARMTIGGGLAGLADRLSAVGGRLRLDSARGGGTEVKIWVPVR